MFFRREPYVFSTCTLPMSFRRAPYLRCFSDAPCLTRLQLETLWGRTNLLEASIGRDLGGLLKGSRGSNLSFQKLIWGSKGVKGLLSLIPKTALGTKPKSATTARTASTPD